MVQALITGLLTGLILSFAVGYVVFAIIRYSINDGPKAGVSFVLGVSAADMIFVALSVWASAFLLRVEGYEKQIGIIGSLAFMAIGLYGLLASQNLYSLRNNNVVNTSGGDLVKIWLAGLMLNLLNPGAIALWLSVNIAVIDYTLNQKIVFFAAVLSMTLLTDLFKVFLAGLLRKSLTVRTTFYLNKISSGLFVVLGLGLLIKSLFFT